MRWLRSFCIVLSVYLFFTAVVTPSAAQESDSIGNLRLVFVEYDNMQPTGRLAIAAADGSGFAYLSETGEYSHPAWSPDGQKIAFVQKVDGARNIFTMNPDGSGVTQVTTCTRTCAFPAWSPDGTRIAFSSITGFLDEMTIHIINADGTGVRELSKLTPDNGSHWLPAWSPDGTRIAFVLKGATRRSGGIAAKTDVIALLTVSSGAQLETNERSEAGIYGLSWYPDSRRILVKFGTANYVYDTVTARSEEIVTSLGYTTAVRWLSDGSAIVASATQKEPLSLVTDSGERVTQQTSLNPFLRLFLALPDGSIYKAVDSLEDLQNYTEVASGTFTNVDPDGYPIVTKRAPVTTLTALAADGTVIQSFHFPVDVGNAWTIEPKPLNAADCRITASRNANVRSQPSTSGAVLRQVTAGETIQAVGQALADDGFTWWQLAGEGYIRADLVTATPACALVPVVE